MGMENEKMVSKLAILPALTNLPNLVSGFHSSSPNLLLGGLGPPYLGGPSLLPLPPLPNPLPNPFPSP